MNRTDMSPVGNEMPENIGDATTVPTSELPGGAPEEEMKTVHEHKLGHLQSTKKTIDS